MKIKHLCKNCKDCLDADADDAERVEHAYLNCEICLNPCEYTLQKPIEVPPGSFAECLKGKSAEFLQRRVNSLFEEARKDYLEALEYRRLGAAKEEVAKRLTRESFAPVT